MIINQLLIIFWVYCDFRRSMLIAIVYFQFNITNLESLFLVL